MNPDESYSLLKYILVGELNREYILLPKNQAILDEMGGSLLHAAGGCGLWEKEIGLISRVGKDYPREWLETIKKYGFDSHGIKILPDEMDIRTFAAYPDYETCVTTEPLSQFTKAGLKVPSSILGYIPPQPQADSRTQPTIRTIRINDIPSDYKDALAAHICPMDYMSHMLVPSALRQGQVVTVTLDPGENYMTPTFWDDIPALVKGLTAFLVSEQKITALFKGRSQDLWEMAETIGGYGCEIVVIKRGGRGQNLYVHANHERWTIPAYPARVVNPRGAGNSFCGGFLAGYRLAYNPLQAALFGNISASFTVEGHHPLYPLEALSGLANARVEALKNNVHRV